MKAPKIKPMKMPMPTTRGVRAGQAAAAATSYAYHPPAEDKGPSRMRRPKGGHGPHNPEE